MKMPLIGLDTKCVTSSGQAVSDPDKSIENLKILYIILKLVRRCILKWEAESTEDDLKN